MHSRRIVTQTIMRHPSACARLRLARGSAATRKANAAVHFCHFDRSGEYGVRGCRRIDCIARWEMGERLGRARVKSPTPVSFRFFGRSPTTRDVFQRRHKQVCSLQGVAVFNRQLNKPWPRKRRSLAYYSSRATSGRWEDSSLCSCSGIRPAFLDAPCNSLRAESLVNKNRLATGWLDRESRR